MTWNDWLFRQINGSSEALAPVMHFFSEAISYSWMRAALAVLAIAMIARGPRPRATVLQALLAVALANGLTDLFKLVLPEPRPYQQIATALLHTPGHAAGPMMGVMGGNYGTASAHSANMAAVALVFCLRLRWWGAPWVAVALATGYSRIYLAAHYPYQVLLGYACGCSAALIVAQTWDLLSRRRDRNGRTLEAGKTNENAT